MISGAGRFLKTISPGPVRFLVSSRSPPVLLAVFCIPCRNHASSSGDLLPGLPTGLSAVPLTSPGTAGAGLLSPLFSAASDDHDHVFCTIFFCAGSHSHTTGAFCVACFAALSWSFCVSFCASLMPSGMTPSHFSTVPRPSRSSVSGPSTMF